MSVDTTFKPLAPTVIVTTAAVQTSPPGSNPAGISTFRIHNNAGTKQILAWGSTATNAAAALAAYVVPGPANAFTMEIAEVVYLELPYNTFFIGNTASTFDVTPGIGGSGG